MEEKDVKILETKLAELNEKRAKLDKERDKFWREQLLPLSLEQAFLEKEMSILKLGLDEGSCCKVEWDDEDYNELRFYKILHWNGDRAEIFEINETEDYESCSISITHEQREFFIGSTHLSPVEFDIILKRVLYRMQHQLSESDFSQEEMEEEEKENTEEKKHRIEREKLRQEAGKSQKLF